MRKGFFAPWILIPRDVALCAKLEPNPKRSAALLANQAVPFVTTLKPCCSLGVLAIANMM